LLLQTQHASLETFEKNVFMMIIGDFGKQQNINWLSKIKFLWESVLLQTNSLLSNQWSLWILECIHLTFVIVPSYRVILFNSLVLMRCAITSNTTGLDGIPLVFVMLLCHWFYLLLCLLNCLILSLLPLHSPVSRRFPMSSQFHPFCPRKGFWERYAWENGWLHHR
jgi:hypothetical protein